MFMSIKDNWQRFQDELQNSTEYYHRDLSSISVMAVSKTRSVDEIREAGIQGLSIFGENRVEEASEKFAHLDSDQYPLYLIGHLQGNKVGRIDARYTAVHSIDSLKTAHRLSRHRESLKLPLEVLMQVNTSGEDSKSGFRDPVEFLESAAEIAELPYLEFGGLMTMAPFVDDETEVRSCFSLCREWSEKIKNLINGETILSMGMSSDYKWAVAEGSTLLRIGTSIFGGRE